MADGLLQGDQGQLRVDVARQLPAHAAARPNIEDRRQGDKGGRQPDGGEVGDPRLVQAVHRQLAQQVRVAGEAMPGVGRDDEAAFELAQQRFLAHDAQDALGIDAPALTAERMGDPPVAVPGEVEHDPLDGVAQRHRHRIRAAR